MKIKTASGKTRVEIPRNASIEEGQISLSLKLAISCFRCRRSIWIINNMTNGWRWRLLVIGAFDHHIDTIILTIYIRNICFYSYFFYKETPTHIYIHSLEIGNNVALLSIHLWQYDLSKPIWVCMCKCLHLMCWCWFEPWYFQQIKTITECITFYTTLNVLVRKQLSIYWISESCVCHSSQNVRYHRIHKYDIKN